MTVIIIQLINLNRTILCKDLIKEHSPHTHQLQVLIVNLVRVTHLKLVSKISNLEVRDSPLIPEKTLSLPGITCSYLRKEWVVRDLCYQETEIKVITIVIIMMKRRMKIVVVRDMAIILINRIEVIHNIVMYPSLCKIDQ